MVIVQGTGRVDAELRERFLAQRTESMQISRAEPGNLEYVIAADPIEANRVIVSERWETQEDSHGSPPRCRRAASSWRTR